MSYIDEWHAQQRAEQQQAEPQVYEFIQQTPPAQAAVDPRVKAVIDAEKKELLKKVRPQAVPAQSLPGASSEGFRHVAQTPPAGRGFGEVQQR